MSTERRPRRAVVLGPQYRDSFAENIAMALRGMGIDTTCVESRSPFTRNALQPTRWVRVRKVIEANALELRSARQRLVDDPIRRQLEAAQPDLVISTYGYFQPQQVDLFRRATPRATWALWYPDALANLGPQLPFDSPYDQLFFKDPYLVDLLTSRTRVSAHYLPEACLPERHRNEAPATDTERATYGCDVALAGNIYPYRARILETLPPHISLRLYGNLARTVRSPRVVDAFTGEYVTDRAKFLAFTCAKVVLNTLHYGEVCSANARLFEATACGAFVITHINDGIRDLFVDGVEVVGIGSATELRDAIDHYVNAEDERFAVAAAGQRRAHRDHTYERRLDQLFEVTADNA